MMPSHSARNQSLYLNTAISSNYFLHMYALTHRAVKHPWLRDFRNSSVSTELVYYQLDRVELVNEP